MRKKLIVLLAGLVFISPFAFLETVNANNTTFEQIHSGSTLPNRRMRDSERNNWIDEYWFLGGPSSFELEVVRLINDIRQEYGLSRVQLDYTLGMAGRFQTHTMYQFRTRENWSHNVGPYSVSNARHGGSANIAATFGGNLRWSGGNAAWGHATPERVVNGWMNSPGHHAYIVSPEHRFIGVGRHSTFTYMFMSERPSNPRLYVTPITTPAITRSTTSVIRQTPESNGTPVRTLTRGQEVLATGVTNDGWMRVAIGNETGWVRESGMRMIQRFGIITQRSTLRQSPNSASGEVRDLSRNTEVIILGTYGSWSHVQHGRNVGWVRTARIQEVTQTAVVEVSRTDMRTGPSTSFDRITRIERNERVTVVGRSGSWLQVQSGRHTGWVAASDMRISSLHAVTTNSTALREGASSSTTRIRTLANNKPVFILAEGGAWTHVQQGDLTGWVRTSDVRVSRNSGTTGRNAALRSRPRSNATRLTTINSGTRTRAIAVHGDWSLVQAGNHTGWMRTSDIR